MSRHFKIKAASISGYFFFFKIYTQSAPFAHVVMFTYARAALRPNCMRSAHRRAAHLDSLMRVRACTFSDDETPIITHFAACVSAVVGYNALTLPLGFTSKCVCSWYIVCWWYGVKMRYRGDVQLACFCRFGRVIVGCLRAALKMRAH